MVTVIRKPGNKEIDARLEVAEWFTYTGKKINPKVTIKFNGVKLSKKNYKISYKNNKKKGTATIIIKGKGNFVGKKKIKFKIK